ncbi:MAG TPA: hypothetical protein VFT80_05625, partial [Actinomycetota bacterium]|nr:hypothetical protein [Actinomycetota bacterium]
MRTRIMAAALTAALLVVGLVAPAVAGPRPPKPWNLYQDKLGAYVCSTAVPKGQVLIAGPFGNQAACLAAMTAEPTIVWDSGIADGDSFYVGSVPAEPTCSVTGEKFVIPTECAVSGYGTGVGAHTLIAEATNVMGVTATQQRGYTVALKPAEVVKPTAFDETFSGTPGVANKGGINIPNVEGIDYFIDGVPADAGVHEFFASTHEVTAEAQPGYEMTGYPDGGWSLTIAAAPVFVEVTPAAPVAVDEEFVSPGIASQGGIDITATTGVDYFIDGVLVSGFVPLDPGTYLVTAQPQEYYRLAGQHVWTLEVVGFDPTVHATAAAPSKTDQPEGGSGFITIPESTGADYTLDGAPVLAGNHDVAPGAHTVVATPQFGYVLDGVTSWNLTVKPWTPFTLTAGGYAYQYGTPAGYPALADPVVDNVAHTITWTQPVNSAANPTYYSYFIGTVPNIPLGSFDVDPLALGDKNLANGELGVKVTATLNGDIVGQESKFRLVYQSTVYNNPLSNVSNPPLTLPVTNFDLRGPSSYWDDAVGGHTNPYPGQFETGVAALWSGVT